MNKPKRRIRSAQSLKSQSVCSQITKEQPIVEYPKQDVFYWLKRPTLSRIRTVLEWADKNALRTDISFLDSREMGRRKASKKTFEEVMSHLNRKAKPYFRVILRKDENWYLLLSNEKHIEDLIEIGICGIEIDSNEYFIHCYLKKELMNQLKRKFQLAEDGSSR